MADDGVERFVNIVRNFLGGTTPTPAQVDAACDSVQTIVPLDDEQFVLARRKVEEYVSVLMEDSLVLSDLGSGDHVEWVSSRTEWPYWLRYRQYVLEVEKYPLAVIDQLDRTTLRLLGRLEDPKRPGVWDRRGLVVGQVQSGKTSNYTGLICRAADAGYDLIIVLAGIHNSLRSQTQLRLDEGFLGFDTQQRKTSEGGAQGLGAGTFTHLKVPAAASLTDSKETGDFKNTKKSSVPVQPGSMPILVVCKKHVSILENLRAWLPKDESDQCRLSALVIDDESDNASIDTSKETDTDPTRVNGAIRSLLRTLNRSAYVGYTATPQANVFIPEADHPTVGEDLFPRDFIEYIRPPSNYLGPLRMFGIGAVDDIGSGLPLFRAVDDTGEWMPSKHKKDLRVGQLPKSLTTALRAFVLVCAARRARGQTNKHNSMLVHVTRFTDVQHRVAELVEAELGDIRQRLKYGTAADELLAELEDLWHTDFEVTSGVVSPDGEPLDWATVSGHLAEAVDRFQPVKEINGKSSDALEYFEHRDSGISVVAIGGNKLSRGLTLEGLSVSYYLRGTSMMDTLLQMGRWFGYRPGYEDLCRLCTTRDLYVAYRETTLSSEDLMTTFEYMVEHSKTPTQFGIGVRNSPSGLEVTAANKRRSGTKVKVGFSGSGGGTTVLSCDPVNVRKNLAEVKNFVEVLENDTPGVQDPDGGGTVVYRDVDGRTVSDLFFRRYQTLPEAYKVSAEAIARFIDVCITTGHLERWTVALIGNSEVPAEERYLFGPQQLGLIKRSAKGLGGEDPQIDDRRLYRFNSILSPVDEMLDLHPTVRKRLRDQALAEWEAKPESTRGPKRTVPSGPVIRGERSDKNGLLLIYPVAAPARDESKIHFLTRLPVEHDEPMCGFFVSFPEISNAPSVDYTVNNRYLEELFEGYGDDTD